MTTPEKKKTRYEGRRRLSLDIPEELYDRLNKNFEWGERSRTVIGMLEYACDMIEANGIEALGVFLRTKKYGELSQKVLKEQTNGDD